ncbi:hypothetical protein L7F22_056858 [Adiantum nelumboides]|nr:hypothetical protein [Adiantum nelumboides]
MQAIAEAQRQARETLTDLRLEVSSPWNPAKLVLSTDYDFTCTEEESCELLIRAAEVAMGIDDCRVLKAYFALWDEYQEMLEKRLDESDERLPGLLSSDACDGEQLPFDSGNLRNALRRLADLELLINRKVMLAGLLKGLTRQQIQDAGKHVALQPGCLRVLLGFASLGAPIHVISANWSRDLVYGGLSAIPEHLLSVHCNDLEFDA